MNAAATTGNHPALSPSGRHEAIDPISKDSVSPAASASTSGSRLAKAAAAHSGSWDKTRELAKSSRWIIALIAIVIVRSVALAFFPVLLLEAPATLLAFSPAAADLILVAPLVNPALFFSLSITAAVLQCAVFYEFGRALGDRALQWLEDRRVVRPKQTRRIREWLGKAAGLVVFAGPSLVVAVLAGASNTRARVFYPAVVAGNIVWTIGCYFFGAALTEQLERLYGFIGDHVLALSVIAAALFAGKMLWNRLRPVEDDELDERAELPDLEEG